MKKIIKLHNTIQKYDWGSKEYISRLLKGYTPSPGPEAELWMGAHPKAPSFLYSGQHRISLSDYINKNPIAVLGSYTATKFSYTLPFLFKVLAADKPLSIQAHPNKIQAEEGFKKENRMKIPLTALHRVYKDNNHKPEIICALTPFTALNGFRPIHELIESLTSVKSKTLDSIVDHLKQNKNEIGLKHFFHSIMTCREFEKKQIIKDILCYAKTRTENDLREKWIMFLNHEYPEDIGIISMFLLNFVRLNPGEAMFLPACQFHSYLHGAGIELMANSDNVLRGGLTPKYIDIPELLKIIDFSESNIKVIRPEINWNHEKIYTTPSEEFLLSSITLGHNDVFISEKKRSVEILLCIEGNAYITEFPTQEKSICKKGTSILIPADLHSYEIGGPAYLFKATVPIR